MVRAALGRDSVGRLDASRAALLASALAVGCDAAHGVRQPGGEGARPAARARTPASSSCATTDRRRASTARRRAPARRRQRAARRRGVRGADAEGGEAAARHVRHARQLGLDGRADGVGAVEVGRDRRGAHDVPARSELGGAGRRPAVLPAHEAGRAGRRARRTPTCGASGPCNFIQGCALAGTFCNTNADCKRAATRACCSAGARSRTDFCLPVGGFCGGTRGVPRGNQCVALTGTATARDICDERAVRGARRRGRAAAGRRDGARRLAHGAHARRAHADVGGAHGRDHARAGAREGEHRPPRRRAARDRRPAERVHAGRHGGRRVDRGERASRARRRSRRSSSASSRPRRR